LEEKRIESGIFGLDRIVEGGFRDHTAMVVVGASGTGKSTFAMQFLMHGIDRGEQGL
jgi:KaiC/GvpD/RAD55 family RecA-like ATPase